MSADNWTICPRCQDEHDAATAKRMSAAVESYGKVTPSEYLKLIRVAETKTELEKTLREDYELCMEETGYFSMSYSCSCACGFSFEFKHAQQVPMGRKS